MQDDIQPTQPVISPKPIEPSQPATPVQTPPTIKTSKKMPKTLLFIVVVIVLLAGTAYGAYKWEHSRALKVENDQAAQIKSLNAQVSQTEDQLNSQKQSNAEIAKVAILGYSIQSATGGGVTVPIVLKNNDTLSHSVTVQVTFTNSSGQSLEVDTATLKTLNTGQTQTLTVTGTSKAASYSNLKVEVTKIV